jgi:hypothetical protein
MPAIEPACIAPIETVDRRFKCVLFEPAEHGVVGRHQAEAVTHEESLADEVAKDLHTRHVVGRRLEDVLLGDRPRRDVKVTGVLRTHAESMPAVV